MNILKTFRPIIKTIPAVFIGSFIYSLAVKLFLVPAELVSGGTIGLALTVNHLWNIPVSGFVLIFNIVMLIIGLITIGKSFVATTLLSTLLYPMFLELFDRILGNLILTNDLLLCTVFAGLGVGIGLGIVIRSGSSTGGMDIPPLILKKYLHIPVSISLYVFDFCILLCQMMIRPAENILYGILLVMIYTVTLDKMLILGQNRTEIKIVSPKSEEITDAILKQVDRGVTLIHAEGGYSKNETKLVLSVISNHELIKVEKIVHDIDPECFMIISRVSEVRGKGFSINKYND